MYSNTTSHMATALCAMVSSGKLSLPLSHSHALECVAHFAGYRNWNELAALANSEIAKTHARALREAINVRVCDGFLNPQQAEEAIKQAVGFWAKAGNIELPNDKKCSMLPITFFPHPIDGEWEADNPNLLVDDDEIDPLISQLDSEDTLQQLEKLFAAYPGDIEVCHSLGSRLLSSNRLSEALSVWRHAWDLIKPDLDRVLREAPNAIVSFSSLRNRPILRALHGLILCLERYRDEKSLAEYEKLLQIGYSLMRDRDTFGFRIQLARFLALKNEWHRVKNLMDADDSLTFSEHSLMILALHHLGEKNRRTKMQRALVDYNPFSAEVLLRGRRIDGYVGEFVASHTWQEGAEHLAHFVDLWRINDCWKIWHPYRQRIKFAQISQLKQIWSYRNIIDRKKNYLGALVGYLATCHEKCMPLKVKERPLVPNLIFPDFLTESFDIDVAEVDSFTFQTFEGWLEIGCGLHGKQKGLILEWLVWNMIQKGIRKIIVWNETVYFDGKPITSVSRELEGNLSDIIAYHLSSQLLGHSLRVHAIDQTRVFECKFLGQWRDEDVGIELSQIK